MYSSAFSRQPKISVFFSFRRQISASSMTDWKYFCPYSTTRLLQTSSSTPLGLGGSTLVGSTFCVLSFSMRTSSVLIWLMSVVSLLMQILSISFFSLSMISICSLYLVMVSLSSLSSFELSGAGVGAGCAGFLAMTPSRQMMCFWASSSWSQSSLSLVMQIWI